MNATILASQVILTEMDVVLVRQLVKEQSIKIKLSLVEQTKLITAASEIARNTLVYGRGGELVLSFVEDESHKGLQLVFTDHGPGISDIEQALQSGFTSGKGMGLGLGGAKRLVDKFFITSRLGEGTSITLIKWYS